MSMRDLLELHARGDKKLTCMTGLILFDGIRRTDVSFAVLLPFQC